MIKEDKRYNNIIKELGSDDSNKQINAIKQLRKHGKPESIHNIITVLKDTENETVRASALNFLFDLKDVGAVDTLVDAIKNEPNTAIKAYLLSSIWQSGLDASNHLNFFIDQAIKNDYLVCLEALTIVENFDTSFNEDEVNNAKLDLNEAIEQDASEKRNLLMSLLQVVDTLAVEF